MTAYTEFNKIPLFKYDLLMVDPPWNFANWSDKGEEKNASSQYDCMSLNDIKALRVGELASPNSLLWLWATNPMLPQAIEVLEAWGFTFKTAGTWAKMTAKGNQHFGTGYLLRSACEPFLIGTIGKPKTERRTRSCIMAPVREHSRKPDKAFIEAEHLMPFANRIELFSRQERKKWDVFGNEVGKFE